MFKLTLSTQMRFIKNKQLSRLVHFPNRLLYQIRGISSITWLFLNYQISRKTNKMKREKNKKNKMFTKDCSRANPISNSQKKLANPKNLQILSHIMSILTNMKKFLSKKVKSKSFKRRTPFFPALESHDLQNLFPDGLFRNRITRGTHEKCVFNI